MHGGTKHGWALRAHRVAPTARAGWHSVEQSCGGEWSKNDVEVAANNHPDHEVAAARDKHDRRGQHRRTAPRDDKSRRDQVAEGADDRESLGDLTLGEQGL